MTSFVKYQYPDEEEKFVEGDNFKLDSEYINVTGWQATGEAEIIYDGAATNKTGWFTGHLGR